MTRAFKVGLVVAAGAVLFALFPAQTFSESRNAPNIDNYSALDIDGLYVFRDPANCNPGPGCNLVIAMVVQGLADPLFGDTYHFQSNALYRLSFNTDGTGQSNANIDFAFSTFGNGSACPAPAAPCQTFTATFPASFAPNQTATGVVTEGTSGAVHLPARITNIGPVKIFAGPRENPFSFDYVGFNRAFATSDPTRFTGVDAFRGKNASAIVLEVPFANVFPAGCPSDSPSFPLNAPCGLWASTYLGLSTGSTPAYLRQVDRMAHPLFAELLPLSSRDNFDISSPLADNTLYGLMFLNQVDAIDAAFCSRLATACQTPNPNKSLLQTLMVPDTLKFATGVLDGYPNGRRPEDHVTDLLIQLILQIPGFTDGTTGDKSFCPDFPFLAPPLQLNGTMVPPAQPNPVPCP